MEDVKNVAPVVLCLLDGSWYQTKAAKLTVLCVLPDNVSNSEMRHSPRPTYIRNKSMKTL